MSMTRQELEQAKIAASTIFKGTIAEEKVIESLSKKFDKETLIFVLRAIVGAFDTGFQCCIHYVLNEEDD